MEPECGMAAGPAYAQRRRRPRARRLLRFVCPCGQPGQVASAAAVHHPGRRDRGARQGRREARAEGRLLVRWPARVALGDDDNGLQPARSGLPQPVRCTSREGQAEPPYALEPFGVALVPPEPEILRSTFLGLLGQPDRMKYMRAYSRRLAEERFDWQRNAQHLASQDEIACKTR